MENLRSSERSNYRSIPSLGCNRHRRSIKLDVTAADGEISIPTKREGLGLPSCLLMKISRAKTIGHWNKNLLCEESAGGRGWNLRCLKHSILGGGCKVGVCEELDVSCRRRSNALEDCISGRTASMAEESGDECLPDMFWKKNSRREKEIECDPPIPIEFSVPDDVLELIFLRLPLSSLVVARCVCKKWRCLIMANYFMQMRSRSLHRCPWLFLFGVTRGEHPSVNIHALDVSLDRWYKISDDILKDRFLFSVAGIGAEIYIIGGCSRTEVSSSMLEPARPTNKSLKTHKEALVFCPITGRWHNAASMKAARSAAILGVFEVHPGCSIFHKQFEKQERRRPKPRILRTGGISDVYEDPHRLSLRRRQLTSSFPPSDDLVEKRSTLGKFLELEKRHNSRLALIAVGGYGSWHEPLDTGEIYDPETDEWIEIARFPREFGAACSGTICNAKFYAYSDSDRLASFDLERGFWAMVQTSLPPPRILEYSPKLVSCKNRLYMLSVSWCNRPDLINTSEKAVRKLWELDLWFNTWTEVSRHPDAPMDWNAIFVEDNNMIYGLEMFKIFGQMLDFLTACHISDTELKWSRISRKLRAHTADAASCTMKSMTILHL